MAAAEAPLPPAVVEIIEEAGGSTFFQIDDPDELQLADDRLETILSWWDKINIDGHVRV